MAVVTIPHYEPWIVARWAFSELMCRLADASETSEDRETALAAEALDGMHFDLMETEQQHRLARRLSMVADQYRFDVGAEDLTDERGLGDALAILGMRLNGLFDFPAPKR